jgi:hypothetical protein
MNIARSFTKVYDKERKPLQHKPFSDLIIEFAEAIQDVVVSDVRFALTGEQNTEASADTDGNSEERKDKPC